MIDRDRLTSSSIIGRALLGLASMVGPALPDHSASGGEPTPATAQGESTSVLKREGFEPLKEPIQLCTKPIKKLSGRSVIEIETEMLKGESDNLLRDHLRSLRRSNLNQDVIDRVVVHIRDLSHTLEGCSLTHMSKKEEGPLAGDPSANRLLLVKLSDIAHLFPPSERGVGAKRETEPSGGESEKLIAALDQVLSVNLARLSRLEVDSARQVGDSVILTLPVATLRDQRGGKLATAVLERAMRRGYFEDAKRFFEASPKASEPLLNVGFNILSALSFSKREGSKDIVPTVVRCMEVAATLPRREYALPLAYLQSIAVADRESIEGVTLHAESLEKYIHGLIEAGEPEPENGVFSLCCVEGGLPLYPELVEQLLKVYRATGFLRLDRLQSEPQPGAYREFQVQRGGVGARVRELSALVDDPTFRAHSRVASVIFVGGDDRVAVGPIVEQLDEHGYVAVPGSAKTTAEIGAALARTRSIVKRPSDLVVVVGDFTGVGVPRDLQGSLAPTAQFLFVGDTLGDAGALSARSANLMTGCDSFGSATGAHGAELTFDSEERLSGVRFLIRRPPQVSLPGESEEPQPSLETVRYPARE